MTTELDRIKMCIAHNPPRAAWLPVLIQMLERDAHRLRADAADAGLRVMPDAPELITSFPKRCRKRAKQLEAEAALYRECIATGWTR